LLNVERNVVNGANLSRMPTTERRFGQIENLRQITNFDESHESFLLMI